MVSSTSKKSTSQYDVLIIEVAPPALTKNQKKKARKAASASASDSTSTSATKKPQQQPKRPANEMSQVCSLTEEILENHPTYSKDDVEAAISEMFDKELDYSDISCVIKYLSSNTDTDTDTTTLSTTSSPSPSLSPPSKPVNDAQNQKQPLPTTPPSQPPSTITTNETPILSRLLLTSENKSLTVSFYTLSTWCSTASNVDIVEFINSEAFHVLLRRAVLCSGEEWIKIEGYLGNLFALVCKVGDNGGNGYREEIVELWRGVVVGCREVCGNVNFKSEDGGGDVVVKRLCCVISSFVNANSSTSTSPSSSSSSSSLSSPSSTNASTNNAEEDLQTLLTRLSKLRGSQDAISPTDSLKILFQRRDIQRVGVGICFDIHNLTSVGKTGGNGCEESEEVDSDDEDIEIDAVNDSSDGDLVNLILPKAIQITSKANTNSIKFIELKSSLTILKDEQTLTLKPLQTKLAGYHVNILSIKKQKEDLLKQITALTQKEGTINIEIKEVEVEIQNVTDFSSDEIGKIEEKINTECSVQALIDSTKALDVKVKNLTSRSLKASPVNTKQPGQKLQISNDKKEGENENHQHVKEYINRTKSYLETSTLCASHIFTRLTSTRHQLSQVNQEIDDCVALGGMVNHLVVLRKSVKKLEVMVREDEGVISNLKGDAKGVFDDFSVMFADSNVAVEEGLGKVMEEFDVLFSELGVSSIFCKSVDFKLSSYEGSKGDGEEKKDESKMGIEAIAKPKTQLKPQAQSMPTQQQPAIAPTPAVKKSTFTGWGNQSKTATNDSKAKVNLSDIQHEQKSTAVATKNDNDSGDSIENEGRKKVDKVNLKDIQSEQKAI